MQQIRNGDSEVVGHARRELEMAGLFTVNDKEKYDGFIGRGVLALVKVFDEWTKGDKAKQQAVSSVFNFVTAGDLLSPPTDDPDEWKEYNIEGNTGLQNKRNQFYITRDDRKTWLNLRTGQQGIVTDHLTGKPLEGVDDPNGQTESQSEDQASRADEGDAGDGADAQEPTTSEGDGSSGRSAKVEGGELDAGVEQESSEDQASPEEATPQPSESQEG